MTTYTKSVSYTHLDVYKRQPIDPVVLAEMMPYLTDNFGNPSSIHEYGRKAKAAVEKSRKIVAKYLNASAAEVFFTSCGTESNNMVICLLYTSRCV